MLKRPALLYTAVAAFVGTLAFAWYTHGRGVVHNDPARHISVPSPLTMPLQVQVAYNGSDVFFRYRWPSPTPGIFHDILRFEGGKWVTKGSAVAGSQPDGLHEDRVAMMLDDGSVPEFGRYGGYIAIGQGLTGFRDEVGGRAVQTRDTTATRARNGVGFQPVTVLHHGDQDFLKTHQSYGVHQILVDGQSTDVV
jgi:hypothetical protein